jgi:hypothetical protein
MIYAVRYIVRNRIGLLDESFIFLFSFVWILEICVLILIQIVVNCISVTGKHISLL